MKQLPASEEAIPFPMILLASISTSPCGSNRLFPISCVFLAAACIGASNSLPYSKGALLMFSDESSRTLVRLPTLARNASSGSGVQKSTLLTNLAISHGPPGR